MEANPAGLSPGHQRFLEAQRERVAQLGRTLDGLFPDPQDITLEIGCGHGHYLTAFASGHPGETCLGIDLVSRRISRACGKRDKRQLKNLHFLKAEAGELFMAWPERLRLARVFVLFPDPWPKKRHAKNRILQPQLLDALARYARPSAPLHFRTDHAANFSWVSDQLEAHPLWEIVEAAPWPFEGSSYFQDLLGIHRSLTAICIRGSQG